MILIEIDRRCRTFSSLQWDTIELARMSEESAHQTAHSSGFSRLGVTAPHSLNRSTAGGLKAELNTCDFGPRPRFKYNL